MSRTCVCGHHEAVHRRMCGAPEGCHCHCFAAATPLPAKRLAEMTPMELRRAWSEFFGTLRCNDDAAWTALRDAIRAEALEEEYTFLTSELGKMLTRAERAERDARTLADTLAKQEDCTFATAGKLRTAESALGEAKREGAREALGLLESEVAFPRYAEEIRAFRDREYPATPSGEGKGVTECWLNVERDGEMANLHIRITPEIARRLLALAQTGGRDAE